MRPWFAALALVGSVSACFFITDLDGLGRTAAPTDGGTEASADAGFCLRNAGHVLCSDFDQPDAFAGWAFDREPPDGGVLEISDAFATSPPYSLRSLIQTPDGGSFTTSRLSHVVTVSPKHARLEFVLRSCQVKTGTVPLAELVCLSPNGKSGGVWLHLVGGAMTLRLHPPSGAVYGETSIDVAAVMSLPHRIVLDVVFDADGSVTYANDGVPIVSQTGIDTRCLAQSALVVYVGTAAFPTSPACESFYDDVLFDYDP